MLGTGTQADPWIPESWADFKTAVGTYGKYVSVPENTVYDIDVEETDGRFGQLVINCCKISGHNLIIKNGYWSDRLILGNSSNSVVIEDVHFIDININTSNFGWILYYDGNVGRNYYSFNFNRCTFKSNCSNGRSPFWDNRNGGYVNFYNCYFEWINSNQNVNSSHLCSTGTSHYNNLYYLFEHCYFNINDPTINGNMSWTYITLNNVFLKGVMTRLDINQGVNVISILESSHSTGSGGSIINCLTTSSTINGSWQHISDEQAKNTEYLLSIGFPILPEVGDG